MLNWQTSKKYYGEYTIRQIAQIKNSEYCNFESLL